MNSNRTRTSKLAACGVSLLALALSAALVAPAFAQETAATEDQSADAKSEVVIVTGVRKSLKSSQQIKRDADTVVDSITATDIGSFPDKSVAEALQRVAGITVNRFAASSDTAHFSAEPSGVLVRGLSQVRSEFNGRDTFSANSSRGLSWGDVSPELMSGVDTYKNQTADLIEGGISGSINLRTRLPFDSKGRLLAISADVAYHDLANKTTPDLSGIYSNRWDTDLGEFGVMVNYAYSLVKTNTQGDQLTRVKIFDQSVFNTPVTASNPLGRAYIPSGVNFHDTDYTRTRNGIAAAAQWQNHDHTMLATLQYNDSSYTNEWEERVISAGAFGVWQLPASDVSTDAYVVRPQDGTAPFTFDDSGFFQTGTQTSKFNGSTAQVAFGRNDQGLPFFTGCADWGDPGDAACGRQAAGIGATSRYATNTEKTQDTSFNFKWDVTDRLKLNYDVQYVHATVDSYDMTSDNSTYGNVLFDYSGEHPKITISPATAATNFAASAGGLTNANNYRYGDLMDHAETSEGHEFATRFDVQYAFDSNWLDTIKVGVRYADREQKLRWSTYNWGGIVQPWGTNAGMTTCYSMDSACYPKEYEQLAFGNKLFGGGIINGSNANQFIFTSMDALKDRDGFAAAMNEVALSDRYNNLPEVITAENARIDAVNASHAGEAGYQPLPHVTSLTGVNFPGWTPLCNRNADDPLWMTNNGNDGNVDGCYRRQEKTSVSEKTFAGYVMLKFGKDQTIFGKPYSGNVGLRFVQTTDASDGYLNYPSSNWYVGPGDPDGAGGTENCPAALPGEAEPNPSPNCIDLTNAPNVANAILFSTGLSTTLTSEKTHINWLPSFNLKVNLNDQWLVRFAASRAMSRPDMGYFKNFISIGAPSFDIQCQTADACVKGPDGKPTDFKPIWTASAGNPGIKSTTADQYDLSVENYFAAVGSFSFDIFYKKFYDYIQYGAYQTTFTSNGVTETVRVSGPVNADGASIKGFELAYQRFFDFLPAPWDGLGIQANYTHLSNSGISNTHVSNTSGDGGLNTSGGGILSSVEAIDPHSLEGLSDNAYNVVGMYEKGPWAARLAYNWRSKYLVSASDCCVGLPVWQRAAGFLDGSIRYRVNDNVEISLSASNITGTETVLLQQIEGDIPGKTPNAPMRLVPNAWWKNDRNFQLGVRLKY